MTLLEVLAVLATLAAHPSVMEPDLLYGTGKQSEAHLLRDHFLQVLNMFKSCLHAT